MPFLFALALMLALAGCILPLTGVGAQDLNSIVNNDLNVSEGQNLLVKFFDDFRENMNLYFYKYYRDATEIQMPDLPTQYGPIVNQIITYTDDSYTTLLDNPALYPGTKEELIDGLLLGVEGFSWWNGFISTAELIAGSVTAVGASASASARLDPVASLTPTAFVNSSGSIFIATTTSLKSSMATLVTSSAVNSSSESAAISSVSVSSDGLHVIVNNMVLSVAIMMPFIIFILSV
ncbi:hypothetical protein NADFUDRAFT_39138 [Nadsonia fulvescens var. elongata DSM 6958]|uniref:Uncharacterized protein n=1 Tax=Nadsonia fulvescens var. elongata DSM 6958 TaxID=857566 RepID=A0A1E3PSA7_9ASCO|nr:hypothetical protein NADFUDRAFT_39138 [Nadsonia fulvescens var. elongata DSM 6958]